MSYIKLKLLVPLKVLFYGMKQNDNGNKIIRTVNYASRYKNIDM